MILNNVNPNGKNVVANNLSHINFFFFLKKVKIDFKNNHHLLFFPRDINAGGGRLGWPYLGKGN
jgi:hypothetical protein